ncbi:MAG: cobalt ECF transporter T component CbiQ, partial [Planctomycetota bacterium]
LGAGSLALPRSGLLVFWNILAKSLLGASAVILLTSTTPFPALLGGLAWLRVPRLFIMVLSFAYRYVFVLLDEAQRMKRARDARCYAGQWLWQTQVVGQMLGTLFLRSYERGERVYLAMLARGYETGRECGAGSQTALQDGRPQADWAIEVQRLSYSYPDGTCALREVSFKVARDERVALIGANGAGKSTLLLHLNGILPSSAVAVAGLPVTGANLKSVRRKVGLVFQNPDDQLFCPTVFEDVAFGPRNLHLSAEEVEGRVREGLRSVGMEGAGKRSAFHLSLGQKRRVALATVLALRPEILVLDEPTSHLDPRGRRELAALLKNIGGTLLVATHDLDLAIELCSRAIVLEEGQVLVEGAAGQLLRDKDFLLAHGLA